MIYDFDIWGYLGKILSSHHKKIFIFTLALLILPFVAAQKKASKESYINNDLPIEFNNSNVINIKSDNVSTINTNKLYKSNNIDDPWNEAITTHSDSNSVGYLEFGPEEDIIKVVSRYTFNKNDYSNTTELNYSYLKSLRFFIEDNIEYSIYGEGTLHIGICDTWNTDSGDCNEITASINFKDLTTNKNGGYNEVWFGNYAKKLNSDVDFYVQFTITGTGVDNDGRPSLRFLLDAGSQDTNNSDYYPKRVNIQKSDAWYSYSNKNNIISWVVSSNVFAGDSQINQAWNFDTDLDGWTAAAVNNGKSRLDGLQSGEAKWSEKDGGKAVLVADDSYSSIFTGWSYPWPTTNKEGGENSSLSKNIEIVPISDGKSFYLSFLYKLWPCNSDVTYDQNKRFTKYHTRRDICSRDHTSGVGGGSSPEWKLYIDNNVTTGSPYDNLNQSKWNTANWDLSIENKNSFDIKITLDDYDDYDRHEDQLWLTRGTALYITSIQLMEKVTKPPELETINDTIISQTVDTLSLNISAKDYNGSNVDFKFESDTTFNYWFSYPVYKSDNSLALKLNIDVKDRYLGDYNITVISTDNSWEPGSLDSSSFTLTIANVAPVIASISDTTTKEDESIAVALSAIDAEGDAITFSATPDTTLTVLLSSDTLTITPKLNWHGVASVIVYASDDYSKDSTSFDITVTPVNDLPTAFEWVSGALDTINITQTNLTDNYTLQWDASTDEADGDTINYLLYAGTGAYQKEEVYDTTSTSVLIPYQEFLENVFEQIPMLSRATVRFSVYAHDGTDSVKVTGDDRVVYVNRYEYLSTEGEGIPTEFALHENYPNPFNPTTTLRFDLPELSDVNVIIYNMLGQKVKTFNMQSTPAGYHSIKWNATNDLGDPVSAGVYLYQLKAKEFVKTRKMILLK